MLLMLSIRRSVHQTNQDRSLLQADFVWLHCLAVSLKRDCKVVQVYQPVFHVFGFGNSQLGLTTLVTLFIIDSFVATALTARDTLV